VVIPCRNDAPYLDACLRALATQTRPADEIIGVDNDSVDDTADVARRHGARIVLEPAHGIWPAAARGHDEARGVDNIARVDADSRPRPDWTSRILEAFASDPGLGVLTGGAELYGSTPLVHHLGARWYNLTIRLRPSDGVRYGSDLRMPVSARPFARPSSLVQRLWRVIPTFAASWPAGSPWHRAREAARRAGSAAADVTHTDSGEDLAGKQRR
jgi:glycosyltransferase involved in cell wall biosynthesis